VEADPVSKKGKKSSMKSWSYWWHEWIHPFLLALLLAFFVRAFFIQAFKIPTGSMRTTLMEGDRILVDKTALCGLFVIRLPFSNEVIVSIPLPTFREPKRGDIIVFRYPMDERRDFVKRLVAFGGEVVTINDGRVHINGELLTGQEIFQKVYYYNRPDWKYGKPGQEILVPEDHFFVLGDNSRESSDSRNWGFVPRENLVGRALCIYWPPRRLGGIKQ